MKLRTCQVYTANETGLTFCHCKVGFHWSDSPLSWPKEEHFLFGQMRPPTLVGCPKGAFLRGVALDRQARQWIQVESLRVQEERRVELNLGVDGAALRGPVAGTQIAAAVEQNTRRISDQPPRQTRPQRRQSARASGRVPRTARTRSSAPTAHNHPHKPILEQTGPNGAQTGPVLAQMAPPGSLMSPRPDFHSPGIVVRLQVWSAYSISPSPILRRFHSHPDSSVESLDRPLRKPIDLPFFLIDRL